MLRAANAILHTLKDQVRDVRYALRAEAEVPGSAFPKSVAGVDLAPFIAIGSVVGTPALRLADGLFTQVETLATGVLKPASALPHPFPMPIAAYVGSEDALAGLYGPLKDLATRRGARSVLVSELALDAAGQALRARHGDAFGQGEGLPRGPEAEAETVRACAGLACALAGARPIRRVAFAEGASGAQPFMLDPNLFCAVMVGLAVALVSRDDSLLAQRDDVLESADSAVAARFGRFKRAMTGKDPEADLTREFAAILPFLP